MDKIVQQIAPNMPEDRHVKATRDVMSWYKIVWSTKTLLVPPTNILRTNMMQLEHFSEAVKAFETMDLQARSTNGMTKIWYWTQLLDCSLVLFVKR